MPPTRFSSIRSRAQQLAQTIKTAQMELAVVLGEIYHREHWIEWGFKSFTEYCDQELDFGYRKAMHLIEVADAIQEGLVSIRRARKIGWTKMSIACKVLTAANANEILKLAESVSSRELLERLKATRTLGIKNVSSLTYVVNRTEKQELANRVYSALEKVLEFRQLGISSKEELALETAYGLNVLLKDRPPLREVVG